MNNEEITFKSQYILQYIVKIDPGFIYSITHDCDNNVTGIVWMTSYMRDAFIRFGNHISIDVMISQVCNANKFCYIAPCVLNEIGKMNVVYEGFVIYETHDAYCFILSSIFQMCFRREKGEVYATFSDEFMTKSILDSIGMNETHIFYDHFHLKENLKKTLLCKWKFLKPTIGVMFRVSSHEMLEISCKKATIDYSGNTNCVSTLVNLIDLKNFWVSLIIDSVKGIFGKCGSSWSEFNYSSVNNFVSQFLEGIHGAMQQLMVRQHKLIFQNNEFIFKQYLDIKVIE